MSEIRKAIQKLGGTHGMDMVQLLTCSVDSADEVSRTCMVTPVNNNLASFRAQLMPETDDGILILPSAGSTVQVLFSTLNAPAVIQYSQVDKVLIIAGDTELSMTDGTVQVMQGEAVFTITNGMFNFTNGSQNLTTILQDILQHIAALTVSTGTGPSSVPVNIADFNNDLTNLNQILN